MNQISPKLASTASGMSFEVWKRRPVYKVQCFTADIANQLCGVRLKPGQGIAVVLGVPDAQGLDMFRALAPYRTPAANKLRSRVAERARELRRSKQVKL